MQPERLADGVRDRARVDTRVDDAGLGDGQVGDGAAGTVKLRADAKGEKIEVFTTL